MASRTELTVARHRADLFSLSYDVPNDALRKIGEGMKEKRCTRREWTPGERL